MRRALASRITLLAATLPILPLAAQSTTPPPQPTPIRIAAGQSVTVAIKPREYQTLQLTLDPTRYNELRMELPGAGARGNMVKVQPEPISGPTAADPFTSDSGEDFVRVPFPGQSASTLTLHITVLTNSKADTQPFQTHLTLTSALITPQNQLFAQTISLFNHAERIRRTHTDSNKALTAYQSALQLAQQLNDPVLQQRILLSTGRMLMLDGKHYAESVDYERQAVAITGTDAEPSVAALAWKMLGGALLDMDQYQESLKASAKSLELYEKTGELYWQGIVLENMGNASLNLGDLQQALSTDQRALAIARQLHDDFGTVEMLAEIGSIQRSRGDLQQALNDYAEAVEVILPTAYNPMQGEAWLALGQLHRDLGESAQAAGDLHHALTIAQNTASGLDELDALSALATLQLQQGNASAARDQFTHALTRARELKLLRPQSALLIGIARSELALGHPAAAEPLLHQAIELSASIHQSADTAEAYAALGDLAATASRHAEAYADLSQAASLYQAIPDKAALAQTDAALARIESVDNHLDDALSHLTQAMDILESSRASFSRGDLRTRYFAAQRTTYDQAVTLLMQLDRRNPQSNYAAQAWQVAERSRARSLLDEATVAQRTTRQPSASTPLEASLNATEVKIAALQDQRAQTGTTPEDQAALTRIDEDLHNSILAADELEARIRTVSPQSSDLPLHLTPSAFASSTLGPHDALLEYWTSDITSYAWLIEANGQCTAFQLPGSTTLLRQITAYRRALLARDDTPANETIQGREARLAAADSAANTLAQSLSATIFPPSLLQRLAIVQRLALIADGPLTQLPFAGLRIPGPANSKREYLIQRFELLHAPSAALLALASNPSSPTPLRVAVFADPVYNLADTRLTQHPRQSTPVSLQATRPDPTRAGSLADLAHLPRLPGSRQEAMRIAQIAGPDHAAIFLGFDATPAAVHQLDWSQYPIAHFATHAISQTAGGDSAGILLSMLNPSGQRQDGVLWLRDIYSQHVQRELVVLSGCGTALGETVPGEGVNSLARAFLFSGTRQVAATLWSGDDASLSSLMSLFYQGFILRQQGVAQALRQAQLSLLQQPGYAAPYYWAGFEVEGRWKTH